MLTTKDKSTMIDRNLMQMREYKVVKSNDLIQKSRFQLSLQEQKIILYLISKIKPKDMDLTEHTFEIQDFCRVCGLDTDNGANYRYIKQTLKSLRDRSIWITLENGSETTLAWIDSVTMNRNSGTVMLKIADMMKPYLLHLQQNRTQYDLLYTLAMKSQYSIRLYELLKSYAYQKHIEPFDIEELKRMLFAETYNRYPDFKRYVLDIAMREINTLSDLTVDYEVIKVGRRFSKIKFSAHVKKDLQERIETWARIDEVISPAQISIFKSKL